MSRPSVTVKQPGCNNYAESYIPVIWIAANIKVSLSVSVKKMSFPCRRMKKESTNLTPGFF